MRQMLKTSGVAVLLVLTAFAAPGLGQNPEIDYVGYAWETGGFLPSDFGDVLYMTASAGLIDPIFGVDLGTEEVTFYMYDLVSQGEIDMGGNNVLINYTGGFLEIWRDAAQNACSAVPSPTCRCT